MLNALCVMAAILPTAHSAPPREAPAFEPLGPDVALDQIGLYAIGCTYRDGHTKHFPTGWSGAFDDETGVALQPYGTQKGLPATLLHCPWRGGTGVSYQEFAIHVPKQSHATLTGATAMATSSVGKSDGATFRIYANGQKLLDVNQKDDVWKPFSIDLAPFTGKALILRFETDPGPRNDPSFDFSLWGNRHITFPDLPIRRLKHPTLPPADLLAASSTGSSDVVPVDGDPGSTSVLDQGQNVQFHAQSVRGSLDYFWDLFDTVDHPLFGGVRLTSGAKDAASEATDLASGAHLTWVAPATSASVRRLTRAECGVERTYSVAGQTAHVRILARIIGKSLVFDVSCDRPLISEFDGGSWGPVAYRQPVVTPYYSGQVRYLPVQDLFVNSFLDWTKSNASSIDGTRAVYGALTDGRRNLLHERVVYAASWRLAGALPSIPNPKSPFIRQIGGRLMLDTWGPGFKSIARSFETLADYGIRDCAAIIHDWQRSGYDNALPAHYPANAAMGGDAGMKELVGTGSRLGFPVALHENYVDYYPDFEGFKESDIAHDSQGHRVLAWYQPGTKIQSFAVKPAAILPLAATQSPEIHRRYGTHADYLDVHSAVPPWFHVDFTAGEPGAGTFHEVWETHRKLWSFERQTHGGPVFGEGANHWYWSGLLDGVEAQFGVGWPGNQGMTAPLMVDFDLLRIHQLQANHGMGYYERWWGEPTWPGMPPMSVLDVYRMQEIAYGHAPFLAASTWSKLPYAWLEYNLVTPVAAAYAGVRPSKIEYLVDGQWSSSESAAKAGQWQCPRVTYENGLVVTANSGSKPLNVGPVVLPPHGWSASGSGVTAWTALRYGAIADYSETANHVFANARNAADWNLSGFTHIRPEAANFSQTGPRRFRLGYRWHVGEKLDKDYILFVHFSTQTADPGDEGIQFQGDHHPAKATSAWAPNTVVEDGPWDVTIPPAVADGAYQVGVGLYLPGEGRPLLEGPSDGHQRIVVGTILVRGAGQEIRFVRNRDQSSAKTDIYKEDLNPTGPVVDFGPVRTNGSVNIVRQGNDWVLQTYPRNSHFTLYLSAARFGAPKEVQCQGVMSQPYHPTVKNGYWQLPLNSAQNYRWPGSK